MTPMKQRVVIKLPDTKLLEIPHLEIAATGLSVLFLEKSELGIVKRVVHLNLMDRSLGDARMML